MNPMCVLDFYVSQNVQRGGYGKKIFEHIKKSIKEEIQIYIYICIYQQQYIWQFE